MPKRRHTWFTQWFLDNKLTVVLLNILLLLLIIALFLKVRAVFTPVGQILGIVFPPLVVAGILYYLINPVINWSESHFRIPRIWSISVVFVLVIGILTWIVVSLIPIVQSQINSIINNLPDYWHSFQRALTKLNANPYFQRLHLDQSLSVSKVTKSLSHSFNGVLGTALGNLTSAVTVISNLVMIVLTAPFVLFFLLKDDRKIQPKIIKYVPDRLKVSTAATLSEINRSLSLYIRGQLTVGFWVAVMFAVGYLIGQMPYALLLGIIAGICNLIPYVGSALGLIPALIIALLYGHGLIWIVILVFLVEQTIETRVVSPLVMGNKMNMHPVTTIFVLLVAGGMFGLLGVIFGIPAYAILKILISKTFAWFRHNSIWYQDDSEFLAELPQVKKPNK
ncbi:AI-2E family transporter [Lactobacillus sp. DCY120]|uniref:AI-2E family transporter n=1 Tax=Bombilactobacillus apium TaxID=2675299 RepID=A0A850R374_9LACO|nr:AI-2E family transporter [Bombilactobacillus apium]NVY96810.1 AI-2E family transporter [Bombilactobacillus apium]